MTATSPQPIDVVQETRVRAAPLTVMAQNSFGISAGLVALLACIWVVLNQSLSLATAALILGLGHLSFWSTWRAARTSLTFDYDAITVRNFWKTFEFNWDDVLMVGWDDYWIWTPLILFRIHYFHAQSVLFWIKPSSWPDLPVTISAKATVAQDKRTKEFIVLRLSESAKARGIKFRLSHEDLSKGDNSGPIPYPDDSDIKDSGV